MCQCCSKSHLQEEIRDGFGECCALGQQTRSAIVAQRVARLGQSRWRCRKVINFFWIFGIQKLIDIQCCSEKALRVSKGGRLQSRVALPHMYTIDGEPNLFIIKLEVMPVVGAAAIVVCSYRSL